MHPNDLCSIQKYLSEEETFCPLQNPPTLIPGPVPKESSFSNLISHLREEHNDGLNWIANRIERRVDYWENLQSPPNVGRKIYVFLGLLNEKSEMKITEGLKKGGPLGELVQWSDILASLTALNHDLTVATKFKLSKKTCFKDSFFADYDFILTDIFGAKFIKDGEI